MQIDWEIKSRAHSCSKTGREFRPGELFHTVLYKDKDGFRREDLCDEAWTSREDGDAPFSFWRSKYEPPAPPPPEPMKKDDAESLLRSLIGNEDPGYAKVRYILALMLERKRLLRPIEGNDPDILVYEHLQSGDTFIIPNPHLTMDQIPEVQREVSALLDPASPA
jgi:hypothetical protein